MAAPQSGRRTIEQLRAAEAWKQIGQIKEEEEQPDSSQYHNQYGTLARGLPAMIQTNGLAETVAFLKSKPDKRHHQVLIDHLNGRLISYFRTDKDIMTFIRDMPTDQYRRATAELIAYANWLKRYCESEGWKSSED